ncbi:MAG: hypothetical protein ABI882_09510 [Acidobacteriota bacterium]
MFCPRCGSPTNEGLKYCRNCGLPITPVSTYVATGGTANLTANPTSDIEISEYLTPKQKMILTIVLCLMSPAIVAVLAEWLGSDGDIAAIPAILMPVGIIWAVFHYKSVLRRRTRSQASMMISPPPMQYPPPQVAAAPYQQQLPPQRTNPLAEASRGSVIEDETRKLPHERR